MAEKTYPLAVDGDRWERIKNTVPRNDNLNDSLVDRLDSPTIQGRTDDRGRLRLAHLHEHLEETELKNADVVVAVLEVDGEPTELADGR